MLAQWSEPRDDDRISGSESYHRAHAYLLFALDFFPIVSITRKKVICFSPSSSRGRLTAVLWFTNISAILEELGRRSSPGIVLSYLCTRRTTSLPIFSIELWSWLLPETNNRETQINIKLTHEKICGHHEESARITSKERSSHVSPAKL